MQWLAKKCYPCHSARHGDFSTGAVALPTRPAQGLSAPCMYENRLASRGSPVAPHRACRSCLLKKMKPRLALIGDTAKKGTVKGKGSTASHLEQTYRPGNANYRIQKVSVKLSYLCAWTFYLPTPERLFWCPGMPCFMEGCIRLGPLLTK